MSAGAVAKIKVTSVWPFDYWVLSGWVTEEEERSMRGGGRGAGAGWTITPAVARKLDSFCSCVAAVRAQTRSEQLLQEHGSASAARIAHLALWPAVPAARRESYFSSNIQQTDWSCLELYHCYCLLMVQIWSVRPACACVCLNPSNHNVCNSDTARFEGASSAHSFSHTRPVVPRCADTHFFPLFGFVFMPRFSDICPFRFMSL